MANPPSRPVTLPDEALDALIHVLDAIRHSDGLSRTEIADYLGLTIETVSRQLARLRDRGVLSVGASRTVTIHRRDQLEAALETEQPGERAKEAARV